jgi:hypothetical protein
LVVVAVSTTVAAVAAGTAAMASDGSSDVNANSLHEHLTGYEETLLALSTTGEGDFQAQIDENNQEISYELSYSSLEGNVLQAHIHFGAVAQSGGISVFLCSNLGNGPAGTQACPPAPATVSGIIRPADVIGPDTPPTKQGITAGEFSELIAAIRAGATYVNVHSSLYPGGEIRAQLGHNH